MSITVLDFPASKELKEEMEFHVNNKDGLAIFSKIKSRQDLMTYVESSFEYKDLVYFAKNLPPSRILDIGVAYGLTSIYLAAAGHAVTALEPSLALCKEMEEHSRQLGLEINIINATAEVVDQLDSAFDAALFYSSLHHCDDPVLALKNVLHKLKSGGRVFLFEPVLKFYRTKKWFYETLKTHPEKLGHYGGNEHIYRFSEYADFLKTAGFSDVKAEPSATYSDIPKKAPWDNPPRYFVKRLYFTFVRKILAHHFIGGAAKPFLFQLSLLNPRISASKESS